MEKLLLLYFLLIVNATFAQKRPTVYKSYFNNKDPFIINNLVLSTDGFFFYFTSCECGKEYYGKGKWQIKANQLYLQGFDSTKVFPQSTISYIKGGPTDSVIIRAFDYFGKPIKSLLLGLLDKDSSVSRFPEFVDKEGKLTISKKDYSGFFLIYEARAATGLLKKEDYHYLFDEQTKEIVIRFDFADAGFDSEPILTNYGKHTFTIRNGHLYGRGEKPAFVTTPYAN